MKKCIIYIELFFYVTLFHLWKGVESHPSSSSKSVSPLSSQIPTDKSSKSESQNGSIFDSLESQSITTSLTSQPETTLDTKLPVTSPVIPAPKSITLDIDTTESTSEFDFAEIGNINTFTPKDGHVFNKVTQGTNVIWESDGKSGTIVRTKLFSNNEKYLLIILINSLFSLFHQSDENQPWTNATGDRYDVTKFKFLGEDENDIKSNNYTVSILELFYSFKFKTGSMCTMIKYDNDVVWKSTDTKKFSNITTFYFGLVSNRFFVKNSYGELKRIDFKPVIKELAIPITKQTPTPKSDPNLNITPFNNVTVDIENTNGTSEFEYSKDGNCCIYSTKTGYSFGKVAQGETVIWESKDNVLGTLIRTWNDDFLAILLSNNLFKLFQHLSGNWSDITAERRDVTKLKFYGDGDNEITSVDYSVSFVKDYLYEFSFNDGVKCSKIKYKEKVVWRNMKGKMYEDIKMFQLGLLSNNFFIKNQFEYRKLTNPSIEITPVTLDIDRTYCTSQYEFSKNDNCRTYTSKYGYSINKIVKKNINIWDADPDDNALKVVLIGSGKDEKHLSILLESGDFVLLHKTRRDLFWKDITDKKSDFSDIKMYSLDDENNYNELRPLHNSIILYNTFYGYEFKKGVKCAKITNKDKLLWTHTDDPDFGYPSAIYLDLLKNKFNVINFKDQTKELKGEGPAVTLFINIDIYHHDLDHYENVSLTLDL